MTQNKPICDPLTEWVMEEGWRLTYNFIMEIEHELNSRGILSAQQLMVSGNMVIKWFEFVRKN